MKNLMIYLIGYPLFTLALFALSILFLALCLVALVILMPICIIASPFMYFIEDNH